MLQFLVCSDIHTYADNLRLAILKANHIDAVLIAGDLELEKEAVLAATGTLPCYMVCGNNDYYLNTDYPQELLIDICRKADASSTGPADTAFRTSPTDPTFPTGQTCQGGPVLGRVTELGYDSVPDAGIQQASHKEGILPAIRSFFSSHMTFASKKEKLPRGLDFPPHTFKRPPDIIHRILMTHGKEYNVPDINLLTRRAGIWDADLVVFGHTHQFWDTSSQRGKIRLINPGCLVGDPKASIRTYGNYEICSFALLRIGDHGEIDVEHLYL